MKYSRLLKADQQKESFFFSTFGLGEFMNGAFEALRMQDPQRFEYYLNMLPFHMDTHEFLYTPLPYEFGTTVEDEIRQLAEQQGPNMVEWQNIANDLGVSFSAFDQHPMQDFNDPFFSFY